MKFGWVETEQTEGALLAHALRLGARRLSKAHRLTRDDVAAIAASGIAGLTIARLDDGDVDEDSAARRIGIALRIEGIDVGPASTGRVNLYAAKAGLFRVDRNLVDAVNAIDPSITIATVAPFARVSAGQMVATVKIIPFAVDESLVVRAERLGSGHEIFAVKPFEPQRIALIQTTLPSIKPSVLDKTRRVTQQRLDRTGSAIVHEVRVAHDAEILAEAMRDIHGTVDIVLIFGASALCDANDVIPRAIRIAGGEVERVGMPVDPGNLLVLGQVADTTIVGAPGCARSPKENGLDWVLERLAAGLTVTDGDVAAMGVGGLLMEIPTRPQPREQVQRAVPSDVCSVVLAAGRSSRMGGPNKLLATFEGQPLVRRVVSAVGAANISRVVVVTGHQADQVETAIANQDVSYVHNPQYGEGLSTSLRAGISALPESAAAALIVLADMPAIRTGDVARLIAAFHENDGLAVVRATHDGKRGNPVLIPRRLFPLISEIEGDMGARHIIEREGVDIVDVEIGAAASLDVDTPQAMAAAGGKLEPSR